jgi:hypothetical protein
MDEKKPIGVLFDSIPYHNEKDLNLIIDSISTPQSIFFITRALEYSYKMGIFTLTESEIVSKSLRQFTSHFQENNPSESI